MIKIDAQGRLAFQPELKLVGNNFKVCEFRLLSSRWAKGQEHTEAATFFCFGEDAERFCELTEKGQEISATGVQETSHYTDSKGEKKTTIKYRMTWWEGGRKPYRADPATQSNGQGNAQQNGQRNGHPGANGNGQGYSRPQGQQQPAQRPVQPANQNGGRAQQGGYQNRNDERGSSGGNQRYEPPQQNTNQDHGHDFDRHAGSPDDDSGYGGGHDFPSDQEFL